MGAGGDWLALARPFAEENVVSVALAADVLRCAMVTFPRLQGATNTYAFVGGRELFSIILARLGTGSAAPFLDGI